MRTRAGCFLSLPVQASESWNEQQEPQGNPGSYVQGDLIEERAPLIKVIPLDERDSLRLWLDYQRDAFVHKVQGTDAYGLAFSPLGAAISLGGLIRRMCDVETYWFQRVFKGETVPDRWESPWEPTDDLSGDQLIAIFEETCADNREIESEASSLDRRSAGTVAWADGARPNLRWIMSHLIEEEARHNGHADLLREMLDGATGE